MNRRPTNSLEVRRGTYHSDMAASRQGSGRKLLWKTRAARPKATLTPSLQAAIKVFEVRRDSASNKVGPKRTCRMGVKETIWAQKGRARTRAAAPAIGQALTTWIHPCTGA